MTTIQRYCFGCDMALEHCVCHLAGLGEGAGPREPDKDATIARLTAELAEVGRALSTQVHLTNEQQLRAEKAEAERDALIGAAYEAAAKAAFNAIAKYPLRTMLTNTDNATMLELAIMALTPAAATAALATVRSEARKEGMLKAAGMFHEDQVRVWTDEVLTDLALSDVLVVETYEDKLTAADQVRDGFNNARDAIIAAAEKGPST